MEIVFFPTQFHIVWDSSFLEKFGVLHDPKHLWAFPLSSQLLVLHGSEHRVTMG